MTDSLHSDFSTRIEEMAFNPLRVCAQQTRERCEAFHTHAVVFGFGSEMILTQAVTLLPPVTHRSMKDHDIVSFTHTVPNWDVKCK